MNGSKSFEIDGNRLTPIVSGSDRLRALLDLIAGARQSLKLLYYIYAEDEAGCAVREALIGAEKRGIEVSLVVDGFGSSVGKEFLAPLEVAGADLCHFLPRLGRRYLLRNHQKMAIADGERAMVGGFNIENAYFADDNADGWRDLGLMVEGLAAKHLAGYFDALSVWSHRPNARMRDLRRALRQWSETEGAVRWLLGGPTKRLNPLVRSVKADLTGAKRIDLIAAYFAPNPAMMRRIERVARRGLRTGSGGASLMTAGRSDNDATIAAARHCYARMLRRGVRIWEYRRQRLHTKLLVIDDLVYVGSANFDMRSLFLNLEVMLRVEDKGFAEYMRSFVVDERAEAKEITREAHHQHSSWTRRLRWAVAYFVVAVLDSNVTRRLNLGTAAD
jgi:cardiolipin synthase